MSDAQLVALQGVALTIVAAVATLGAISADASTAVTAVVTAVFVAIGSFLVKPVAK